MEIATIHKNKMSNLFMADWITIKNHRTTNNNVSIEKSNTCFLRRLSAKVNTKNTIIDGEKTHYLFCHRRLICLHF